MQQEVGPGFLSPLFRALGGSESGGGAFRAEEKAREARGFLQSFFKKM